MALPICFAVPENTPLGQTFKSQYGKEQKDYYLKLQNYHRLGKNPVRILVKLNARLDGEQMGLYDREYDNLDNLSNRWCTGITTAIDVINAATPGLDLVFVYISDDEQSDDEKSDDEKSDADFDHTILIIGEKTGGCACHFHIKHKDCKYPLIHFANDWEPKTNTEYTGTAIHEILHAFSVQHEHQRKDTELYGVELSCPQKHKLNKFETPTSSYKCDSNQCGYSKQAEGSIMYGCRKCDYDLCNSCIRQQGANENYYGVTPYDPYSVMHYSSCHWYVDENKWAAIHVKNGAFNGNRMSYLSPLDKIGLNVLFRPCIRSKSYKLNNKRYEAYYPSLSNQTKLMYCSRRNGTKGHNYPSKDLTDGQCGPTDSACCASCRVLENDSLPKRNDVGRQVWLGYSNIFYCGGKNYNKNTNGVCGPEQGTPCSSCAKLQVGACPGKHGLYRFSTPKSGYGCDKCAQKFSKGTTLYGCRKCNYDLCGNCYI